MSCDLTKLGGRSLLVNVLLLVAALFSGCASNPIAQFYKDYAKLQPASFQQRLLPPAHEPRVTVTSLTNHRAEGERLMQRNFALVGEANFRGGAPSEQQLLQQAKKVSAEIILFSSELSHTEQGIRPVFTYQPGVNSQTTYSGTANATAFGSSGFATGTGSYSGNSTTTTQGTLNTQYVPYQRDVHSHAASFWRRLRPRIFGADTSPLPDELRTTLQRNTGVYVTTVIDGSPAFHANILRGDVVIQLADRQVGTPEDLASLLTTSAGQKVTLKILRGTQVLEKEVQLNPAF